ncbi:hypothetical protein QJQ45_000869 [Haematococcus lacustris]|nr:hypothetical protein QJQ45_000869 [Haematococcus lacustris]
MGEVRRRCVKRARLAQCPGAQANARTKAQSSVAIVPNNGLRSFPATQTKSLTGALSSRHASTKTSDAVRGAAPQCCHLHSSSGRHLLSPAKAVLQACRKVVERANSGKPTDRVPGKVVTVDEFRTSRVSSILNSPQPCEEELDSSKPTRPKDWKPQPAQVKNRLLRSAWSKRFEAPVRGLMWCPWLAQATPGDLGKWVDRDCNAALNLRRAGESKWRPLELCRWQHQGRLLAQGKEYPALGFKKLRERSPKAQAQQPVAQ